MNQSAKITRAPAEKGRMRMKQAEGIQWNRLEMQLFSALKEAAWTALNFVEMLL